MANEVQSQGEQASGGGFGRILLVVAVVLVAAIAGLSTYLFVLAPMLKKPDAVVQAEVVEAMPANPVFIEFPQTPVNVIREGEMPASTLLFGVTLECNNPETAALVQAHRARFVDIINKLHDSRTRSELDDTLLIKESIERQALQKCNDLLRRLQDTPNDDIKITAVLHHTFVVQDPL